MNITIAHFGTHYVNMSGGVEKVTCAFANEMVRKGHNVVILYRDGTEGNPYFYLDPRVKQYNILFENGRKVVSEKLPFVLRTYREIARLFSQKKAQGINAKFKGKQYGKRIADYFKSHDADIIVSCSAPSTKYVITDGGIKIPVIQMIHADPDIQFPLFSDAEREAVAKCQAMQILVKSGEDTAKKYFPGLPLVVIGNPIDCDVMKADPGDKKDTYKIICVGNLENRKNQKFLVHAFEKIMGEYPDWHVELWGDYNSIYGRSLKQYIEKNHLDSQIHVMGKTNKIEEVDAASDIFAIPSHSEGFPLGLAEAMAAGLPALGFTSCGGVNSLIIDGKTGFLTEDGDLSAYIEKLRKLMDDAALRSQMGNAGNEYIQQYRPENVWEQWEHLLQDVVKNKKG